MGGSGGSCGAAEMIIVEENNMKDYVTLFTQKDYVTLFTGGDGFGIGAQAVGLKPSWGVEIDGQVADWAELNTPGLSVIRSDVSAIDYSSLATPHWLHASPPCLNASLAKQGDEQGFDIIMARAVCSSIKALLPPVFSLENVWAYREFEAFKTILRCLTGSGYNFNYWHLNAADYGVPQTRKRLILLASRSLTVPDGIPATHYKLDQKNSLQGLRSMLWLPWNGWYKAIDDLIPDLPRSEFAPWQRKGLSEKLTDSFDGGMPRAFLVHQGTRSSPLDPARPADTITANSNQSGVRAFIVSGQYGSLGSDGQRGVGIRSGIEPAYTVTTRSGPVGNPINALLDHGYIVTMTPRALARFQSVPDGYQLPQKNGRACKIIGNMVPPLLAQRIVEEVMK